MSDLCSRARLWTVETDINAERSDENRSWTIEVNGKNDSVLTVQAPESKDQRIYSTASDVSRDH